MLEIIIDLTIIVVSVVAIVVVVKNWKRHSKGGQNHDN